MMNSLKDPCLCMNENLCTEGILSNIGELCITDVNGQLFNLSTDDGKHTASLAAVFSMMLLDTEIITKIS